jgi:hypothetical protein
MKPNVKVAEQFGNLTARAEYPAAHALLTKEAQKIHSPDEFKRTIEELR